MLIPDKTEKDAISPVSSVVAVYGQHDGERLLSSSTTNPITRIHIQKAAIAQGKKHQLTYNNNSHYAPTCYAWDVVNEAFDEDGTLRSTIFSSTIGPDYIAHAFRFARKYAPPTTKLYYNDYNIETINAKSDAARALVRSLLSDNSTSVPLINGIGLQSHFIAGSSPSRADQAANMAAFLALSPALDVAITELDVRVELPNDAAKTAQQASDYADAVQACVDNAPRCVGVTVWDFYDPLSWVPSTFPGEGDATLFWANYTRKPAYYSVADVLKG